jgi:lysophospholipase L1-like esterase
MVTSMSHPMIPLAANLLSLFRRRAFIAAAAAALGLALTASAQEPPVVNWPVPTPPPGTNPAIFPVPRNEWLVHVLRNLARARQGNIDLLFDGDSITDNWQSTGKEVWARNYGKLNAADFGISGDRTEFVLWRLEKGQLDGLHPKLVVLLIGTNNIGYESDPQVAEGVAAVVHEYQKRCPEAIILLQAIFPRGEKPNDPSRAKIKNINSIISKLGDGKKVIYVDFGDKFLQPDGTIAHEIMGDYLHPSAKGYEIWANAIRPEIERVFGPTGTAPQ